jgi:hypothetical protein
VLSELEDRLANVLGARLPAPFTGRVRVEPDEPAGPGPSVQLGVVRATRVDEEFMSTRHERLPEQTQLQRIVRLRCDIVVDVTPAAGQDRDQQMEGIDRLLFLLDDAAMRDGTALAEPGDQGFLLEELTVTEVVPPALTIGARGWFWPVGEAGIDGPQIDRMILRQAVLPIGLRPATGRFVAGAPTTPLELVLGTSGLDLEAGQPVTAAPFGSLAVGLLGPGGQPGGGTLSGGTAGPDGRRVVALTDGVATLTYQPPPTAGTEQLVVSMFVVDSDGVERVGIELARFPLLVVAS